MAAEVWPLTPHLNGMLCGADRPSLESGPTVVVPAEQVRSRFVPAWAQALRQDAGRLWLSRWGEGWMVLEDLIEGWDGAETVIRFDRPTGTWMFVCVHSTVRGPAGGGTRMATYRAPADGLADAMRLSAAMTRKMAVLQMPFGGGKAVLAVRELPAGEERRGLLLRYGDMVASLGGIFRTAADMNTSAADMDVIAERCRYVYGRSRDQGGAGDSGWGTARGVFHGIRASLGHVFGSEDVAGRRVLVQGVGNVGAELARALAGAGAKVLVSDVAAGRAAAVAAVVGATVVPAADLLETSCEVYAPCAVGGTLSSGSIPG